jgi:hypothetical protein
LVVCHDPTCNQTVMSGGMKIGFVDTLAFSSENDPVCRVSMRPILVRNWCGYSRPAIDVHRLLRAFTLIT